MPTMVLDLKDRMIVEYEERRDKTHQAVDDVEGSVEGQTCPSCRKRITKWCFIQGCFDWCLEHSAAFTGDHGQAMAYRVAKSKDSSGNMITTESSIAVKKCSSPDADAHCDVIRSEYSREEWQEEERVQWMADQMRRKSP
ncbi:hypothetical protein AFLA70_614g000271 [Aspergillus flavus AF70]|nr:hypothetical protein AFLA70_614g000271 [Aspergillus flavus AF70]